MGSQAKAKRAEIGRGYQLLPVTGPSAGVDLRTEPTLMAAERARTLVNWSLEQPGALVVRPGYLRFSTNALGAQRINGAQRIYLNTAVPSQASTIFTIVGFNGNVLIQTDSGGWGNPGLIDRSSNEYSFPADRDMVAVFDGTKQPMKSTNGSSWTRMGMEAGTVASTLSSKASGSLSASEFEFTYTYKDRDLAVESNASTALSTLTLGATGAIEVQVPNSTDGQVDAIVIYARNKTAAETIRRRASSGPTQAGAHSTITITSSNWTTNDEEPTDHNSPPVLSFGVVWKNRWWARSATRTNRLHFTQLFQPQSWPSLFYIDIPFERGDGITALMPLGDALLVWGQTKAFVIIGQTSLDFEVRPTLGSEDGAFGFRAVAAIENGVMHAGGSGIYIFDGTTDKLLSFDLEPAWRDLVENGNPSDLAKIAIVYHQKRKEVRVAVPRRYPSGTFGEWILDLNRTRTTNQPAWTGTDRTIGGYVNWDGPETQSGNRGRLLSWDSTTPWLFEEATGTTANSSNLTAEYEGPGLTLGTYRGRWVDLRGEYEPHAGTFSAETVVDGQSMGTQSISIGTGIAVYDTGKYDTSQYGGSGRRQFVKMLPLAAEGRSAVQKFTYTGQETFKLFSYHLGIQPETRSRDFGE
jgi:hypothetical protein